MSSNTDINFRRQQYQIESVFWNARFYNLDLKPTMLPIYHYTNWPFSSLQLTSPVWISPKHWSLVQQFLKEGDKEYFSVHLNLSLMFSLDNAVT